MKISGMGNAPQLMTGGPAMAEDEVSKSIKKQIADAQKKLQELSSNDSMSAEEKMKKRQELQKQISDLNNQLRQHQIEQRQEAANAAKKQQKQDSSMEELTGGRRTAKKQEELAETEQRITDARAAQTENLADAGHEIREAAEAEAEEADGKDRKKEDSKKRNCTSVDICL